MNFVKIQNYYVNLDTVLAIQDSGDNLFISFKNAMDQPITLYAKKGEPEGIRLLEALQSPID